MGRINDRRVVPAPSYVGLAPPAIPAAALPGPPARPTGGVTAEAVGAALMLVVAGEARGVPPITGAGPAQVCGTDSAPTLAARPSPAETAPPPPPARRPDATTPVPGPE
jgi:hypothetical protein